jgi:hypothetical protein
MLRNILLTLTGVALVACLLGCQSDTGNPTEVTLDEDIGYAAIWGVVRSYDGLELEGAYILVRQGCFPCGSGYSNENGEYNVKTKEPQGWFQVDCSKEGYYPQSKNLHLSCEYDWELIPIW